MEIDKCKSLIHSFGNDVVELNGLTLLDFFALVYFDVTHLTRVVFGLGVKTKLHVFIEIFLVVELLFALFNLFDNLSSFAKTIEEAYKHSDENH